MMRQAWKTMVTGRPGPVVLDVPFDIFKEEAVKRPTRASGAPTSRAVAAPIRRVLRKPPRC
jgi:acetolactate synthase-1/2/3 large subunit